VLALADAGMVRVVALGPSVTVTEDARGVYARGALGEARGARVVDARGQDPRALLGDDPFLRSAFAGGWVTAARTPFLGPAPSTVPPPFALLREGAQEHLVTGGVWVEPETFLARDPSGDTSGLYALGPLTQGQYPVYLGLWALRVAAERLVRHLATSPQRASPTAFTASPTTRRG
jgi:uncharacterized NAD(P)/FAD-binding protein YdhS